MATPSSIIISPRIITNVDSTRDMVVVEEFGGHRLLPPIICTIDDLKAIIQQTFRRTGNYRTITADKDNDDDGTGEIVTIEFGSDDYDRRKNGEETKKTRTMSQKASSSVNTAHSDGADDAVTVAIDSDEDIDTREDREEVNGKTKFQKAPSSLSSTRIPQPDHDDDLPPPPTASTCAICLDDYEIGDIIAVSGDDECPHFYHLHCAVEYLAVRWINQRRRLQSPASANPCPCCRRPFCTVTMDDVNSALAIGNAADTNTVTTTPPQQ